MFEWCFIIASIASSSSFSPAIPVEIIIGIFVSASAPIKGKFVKSLEATFSLSGVNNFKIFKHPIAHKVSTNSKPFFFACL